MPRRDHGASWRGLKCVGAGSSYSLARGPDHAPARASDRPPILALDISGQTGQDTPYRGVSVMSANVRPDKTPQRSLISLRFFLSGRTNQRKSRTNGHVRPCPANGPFEGFLQGRAHPPYPALAPHNFQKGKPLLTPVPKWHCFKMAHNPPIFPNHPPTKKPRTRAGLGRVDCVSL